MPSPEVKEESDMASVGLRLSLTVKKRLSFIEKVEGIFLMPYKELGGQETSQSVWIMGRGISLYP